MKIDLKLPKRNFLPKDIIPERVRILVYFWVAILSIYWLALFFGKADSNLQSAVKIWIVVVALSLSLAGFAWGMVLVNGARVFGATPLPLALWKDCLSRVLLGSSKIWLLAVLSATALLEFNYQYLSWTSSAVAALFSITLCLSSIGALSYFGLWHKRWGLIALLMLALTLAAWNKFELWMSAPYTYYLPALFCWPFLLWGLMRNWGMHPPVRLHMQDEWQLTPLKKIFAYFQRYTMLDATHSLNDGMNYSKRNVVRNLMSVLMLPILFATLFQPWGSRAGLPHLVALGFYSLYAKLTVSCKDLHWRYLLIPSGFRRGQIATHLLISSMTIGGACLLFLMLIWCVLSWSFFGITPLDNLWLAAPYGYILLEWVFGLCVGIVILSAPQASAASFVLLIFLLLASLLAAYLLLFVANLSVFSTWFIIGPEYAALLIMGIIGMLLLSNRFWTIQRLLPLIAASQNKTSDTVKGEHWFPWPGRSY